jgi:aryl-alcohol dehydrogenase-like predicted oxidoreductase
MHYSRLGQTGLKVSPLCLGCMSFGDPGQGAHPWVLDEDASRPILRRAVEAGINFFDTANVYAGGASEEIKAWGTWGKGPNQGGLSRKALMQAIDDSLRRLGTDYVDLYQIHRWDPETPIEETLEALDDIVRAGKARYIGASSLYAWQFQKALALSKANGWASFVSMQNHLNLLYREEEREMMPLCRDAGIGVIPWSPLARGRLTRPWGATTERLESDKFGKMLYARTEDADRAVVGAVEALATARGLPMAQVALAWVMAKPGVTAPIVGVTSLAQLEDAIATLDVKLSAEEIASIEAAYVPHPVLGHQ